MWLRRSDQKKLNLRAFTKPFREKKFGFLVSHNFDCEVQKAKSEGRSVCCDPKVHLHFFLQHSSSRDKRQHKVILFPFTRNKVFTEYAWRVPFWHYIISWGLTQKSQSIWLVRWWKQTTFAHLHPVAMKSYTSDPGYPIISGTQAKQVHRLPITPFIMPCIKGKFTLGLHHTGF